MKSFHTRHLYCLLGETTIHTRLPRECGDPGKRRLHEVVNNIISIGIDPFGELFVYWIPAFARKTLLESCFFQQAIKMARGEGAFTFIWQQ
jgi:hypothetical protein